MTPLWTAAELVRATGGRMIAPFDASGVSIDTRSLQPGDLFVALRGENGDGHDHLAAAFAAGAAGVMVHRQSGRPSATTSSPENRREATLSPSPPAFAGGEGGVRGAGADGTPNLRLPLSRHPARGDLSRAAKEVIPAKLREGLGEGSNQALIVPDTLAGLTKLGAAGRARFAGQLVAVTGSVGKTTTKEMLRTILAAQGATHAAIASHNNHWGVPLTLARLPSHASFCVVEIGMNHPGEIEPLARLARPHVAVITAIAKAHVGNLGSLAAIAEEKAAIMRGLDDGGIAVLPADSPFLGYLCGVAGGARVVTFGTDPGADVRLIGLTQTAASAELRIGLGGQELCLRIAAPGRHMASNALAAMAAATALRIAPHAAAEALDGFTPISGRGAQRHIILAEGTALLLDESYNGNGASMRAGLDVLSLQDAKRRIAVLGDMLELGDEGPGEHAGLAPDVIRCADLLFTCGPLMRHLHDAVPDRIRVAHAPDAAALAPLVARAVQPGDAILVKGSLGSRMAQVVSALDHVAEPR